MLAALFSLLREPFVNVFGTILFNFTAFPFRQAINFPVFIYRRVKVYSVGKLLLKPTRLSPGLCKIGCLQSAFWGDEPFYPTVFSNKGVWEIRGACQIASGSVFTIGPGGRLATEHDVAFGPHTKLMCSCNIHVGRRVRISWECQIFDTDFHYVVADGYLYNNKKLIEIADFVWIGNRCTIMKGSRILTGSIIASNSLVNKGLSESGVWVGSPVRLVNKQGARLFTTRDSEDLIDAHFLSSDASKISLDDSHIHIKVLD